MYNTHTKKNFVYIFDHTRFFKVKPILSRYPWVSESFSANCQQSQKKMLNYGCQYRWRFKERYSNCSLQHLHHPPTHKFHYKIAWLLCPVHYTKRSAFDNFIHSRRESILACSHIPPPLASGPLSRFTQFTPNARMTQCPVRSRTFNTFLMPSKGLGFNSMEWSAPVK